MAKQKKEEPGTNSDAVPGTKPETEVTEKKLLLDADKFASKIQELFFKRLEEGGLQFPRHEVKAKFKAAVNDAVRSFQ